jgi:hypothetical protein
MKNPGHDCAFVSSKLTKVNDVVERGRGFLGCKLCCNWTHLAQIGEAKTSQDNTGEPYVWKSSQ